MGNWEFDKDDKGMCIEVIESLLDLERKMVNLGLLW